MARTTIQPTYDFLAAPDASPHATRKGPLRDTLRQLPAEGRDPGNNDDIRAQLKRAQYELDALRTERDLSAIQHQQEIKAIEERAEADFKRAQSAQNGGETATRKLDLLQREHQETQSRATNERLALEKKVRDLQADNRGLREELEETQAEAAESVRRHKQEHKELGQRYDTLQSSVEEVQADLLYKTNALNSVQQRLAKKEADNGDLEAEIMRLKAQHADAGAPELLKKELSDQVSYIKKLEMIKRNHEQEIKSMRANAKNVEVVEEQKRALETRLRLTDDLRQELGEAQLQRRLLEDEKRSWTAYLEAQAGSLDGIQYNTPEELAKGFLQERLERLDLLDQVGKLQPELDIREDNIKTLREELTELRSQLALTPANEAGLDDSKTLARLERQKALALKEVEQLRAQMRSLEAEKTEFTPEQVEESHSRRIQELENIIDQYRSDLEAARADLAKLEHQPVLETPKKRAREDDDEQLERTAEMRRRMKVMQQEAHKLHTRTQVLETELRASAAQISSLKESSRTRVLEMRSNPTAEHEAVKMATLRTLREENTALLEQLQGKAGADVIPASTLESNRQQLRELKEQLAKMEKKEMRLKQIWSSKALEFREAVASILGWKLDFMPNGRVKASSILYPSSIVDGEEEENSITFDGENGTMKISGGPKSLFAQEIQGHLDFWVEGRKEVPCFLAACTLEFYERTTRAQKM